MVCLHRVGRRHLPARPRRAASGAAVLGQLLCLQGDEGARGQRLLESKGHKAVNGAAQLALLQGTLCGLHRAVSGVLVGLHIWWPRTVALACHRNILPALLHTDTQP